MTIHRKIGGIHFFAIGPFRIQLSRAKRKRPDLRDLESLRSGIDCIAPEGALNNAIEGAPICPMEPSLPNVSAYTWPEGVAAALEGRR